MPITYIDRSSHGLQIHKSRSAEGNPPRTADPLDLQCFLPKTLDLSVLEPILRIELLYPLYQQRRQKNKSFLEVKRR